MGKSKFNLGQAVKPNNKAPKFAQKRFKDGMTAKVVEKLGNGYYNIKWDNGDIFKVQGSHYEIQDITELLNNTDITLGSLVNVVDRGGIYTTYVKMAEHMNLENFTSGRYPEYEICKTGRVVALAEHLVYKGRIVAAVIIDGKGFLYNVDSLELVETKEIEEKVENFTENLKETLNSDENTEKEEIPEVNLDPTVEMFIKQQNERIKSLQAEIDEKIKDERAECVERLSIVTIATKINKIPSPKVYKLMNQLVEFQPELGNLKIEELYSKAESVLENTLG